jgi:hypothetical protein
MNQQIYRINHRSFHMQLFNYHSLRLVLVLSFALTLGLIGSSSPASATSCSSWLGTPGFNLTFDNQSGVDVDIYWLDYGCVEQPFHANVPSGTSVVQGTFDTHPWVVRDSATNQELLTYIAMGPATVVITSPTPPPATPPAPAPKPALIVPHIGLVQISVGQSQPVYFAPDGGMIRDNEDNALMVPSDADGNGFDTYVVTQMQEVNGEMWIGIFMGSGNWGWVPLDSVTPLSYLPIE